MPTARWHSADQTRDVQTNSEIKGVRTFSFTFLAYSIRLRLADRLNVRNGSLAECPVSPQTFAKLLVRFRTCRHRHPLSVYGWEADISIHGGSPPSPRHSLTSQRLPGTLLKQNIQCEKLLGGVVTDHGRPRLRPRQSNLRSYSLG